MEEESFECHYCEVKFTIIYEEHVNDVTHCPFCATTLDHKDEDDLDLEE